MLQYQFYWYNTVRYCPSTSPTDMIVYRCMGHSNWYDTVRNYPDTRPCSPLLPKYQSYWYPSIHYCPNTSPIDTSQYTTAPGLLLICYSTLCPSISLIDKSQSITAPVPVLLILYSPLLPQYKSYWYDTVHFCPSTSPTYSHFIYHSPLLAYSYQTVHYWLNTSLIDVTQYSISPVPVLLIHYSTLLPQYQSLWYVAVP